MFQKSKLSLGLILSTSLLLTACGGGSDSSDAVIVTEEPIQEPALNDTETSTELPTIQEPEITIDDDFNVLARSERLLSDDTALPPLYDNNNPLPIVKEAETIQALTDGLYSFGLTRIDVPRGNATQYDCTLDNDVTCPTITQYRYDPATDSILAGYWAYQPTQKNWVTLETPDDFFVIPDAKARANTFVDAATAKTFENITFINRQAQLDANQLTYKFGDSIFALSGDMTSIANESFTSPISDNTVVLPMDAQIHQFYIALAEGEILLPEFAEGFMNASGDYQDLAKFRADHTTIDYPACLGSNLIVFDAKSYGAKAYQDEYGYADCFFVDPQPLIASNEPPYQEGIKTQAGIKHIYLDGLHNGFSDEYTSNVQYYPYFSTQGQGIALQPEYAIKIEDALVNEAVIKTVLGAHYNHAEIMELPSL